MLQHFDVITALPELTKFHDCIDIDTYSLKFKNAHYYFYRNVLVVDKPSGICMIDYDDIKTTKGMREISRSSDHFSWSGWYLEITSKFGFKVDFACKEEGVFEWLNTCFSLSIKDKSYTHEDVIREITAELERRNAEIEESPYSYSYAYFSFAAQRYNFFLILRLTSNKKKQKIVLF